MSHQRESIGSYEKTSDGSLATDFINIRNTIARYCIALDSKDFDLLAHVFTEDVQAKFPFGDVLTSREAVAAALEKRLRAVTSQHAITTQLIDIAPDGWTAKATSYFTGIHFGQGIWTGQDVTAWGQYSDQLVRDASCQSLRHPHRAWLIAKRTVTFFGRRGEEGVMDGD